jgi:carbonic anhydrase
MTTTKYCILSIGLCLLIGSCKEKAPAHHHMVWHENTHYNVETPSKALELLKEGNKRFLSGDMINTDYEEHVEANKDDQHPHSAILSCMDSRVPPEIVFDQGIGNVFVIRVAGNIDDSDVLGSLEYAVKIKKVELILVMGHQNCGAVKGSIDDVKLGNLTQLLQHIKPAITGSGPTMLEETAKKNVRLTTADILEKSEVIREIARENKVRIVGAYYHLGTGEVEFLE